MMTSQLSQPSSSISARDIGRNGARPKRAAQCLRKPVMSGAVCMQPRIRAERPRRGHTRTSGLAVRVRHEELPMQIIEERLANRLLALTALALLGGSVALAQTAAAPRLATPVFSQLVVFSLPPEFKSTKPTYEKNSSSFYLRQQVPDGETAGKWSRMI